MSAGTKRPRKTKGTALRQLMQLPAVDRFVERARELELEPREATRNPGQWYARCPAHDDENPSLAIGPTPDGKGARLYCHGLCEQADVLRAFHMPASALFARGRRGARLDAEAAEREAVAARRAHHLMTDAERLDQLARFEGWTPQACEDLSIGRYGSDHVAIPERDQHGRIVGVTFYAPRYKRRAGITPMRSEAGGSRGMVYRPGSSSPVLLVEGVSCAVAALSMGFDAISMPSAKTGLRTAWASLFTGREVTILPDADRAGREAAERAAALLLPCSASVQVVEMHPDRDDGSDLADVLREHSATEAARLLRAAMNSTEIVHRAPRGRRPTERQAVEDYLRAALADGEWHPSTEIFEGRPTGPTGSLVSRRTYEEARKTVGAVSRKQGACWFVGLAHLQPARNREG